MRLIVVTDTHLSPRAIAFNGNWDTVRAFARTVDADLTVHLGDVTVDGVHDPGELRYAHTLSADWPTPMSFLPGNLRHNILDHPVHPSIAATRARLGLPVIETGSA